MEQSENHRNTRRALWDIIVAQKSNTTGKGVCTCREANGLSQGAQHRLSSSKREKRPIINNQAKKQKN